MADKKIKAERPKQPEGRPLQYKDFDSVGKRSMAASMKQQGMVKDNIGAAITAADTAHANESNSELTRDRGRKTAAKLRDMESSVTNSPVTIQGAANRRVAEFDRAVERNRAEHGSVINQLGPGSGIGEHRYSAAGPVSPFPGAVRGAGWYFEHRGDIDASAHRHGFDEDVAVTASAVMSPQNAPENEKAAANELMKAHAEDHHVVPTSDWGAEETGIPLAEPRSYRDLTPKQVSQVSSGKTQAKHGPKLKDQFANSGVDSTQIARGGTGVKDAVPVVRGDVHPDDAINPKTAPKVWSYREATRNAVPDGDDPTGVQAEYNRRARVASGVPANIPLNNMDKSTAGILNPEGTTAEDTWMNTLTMGQPMERGQGGRGRNLIAKDVASHKQLGLSPRLKPDGHESVMKGSNSTATLHAFNNEATIRAARAIGKRTGTVVPSVLAQETSWTEARIRTGKDPEYNAQQRGTRAFSQEGELGLQFQPDRPTVGTGAVPKRDRGDERSPQAKRLGLEF